MKKGYFIWGVAKFPNGKENISRNYVDPEAFSRWANKQFGKDERVTVLEYQTDRTTFDSKIVSTWRA